MKPFLYMNCNGSKSPVFTRSALKHEEDSDCRFWKCFSAESCHYCSIAAILMLAFLGERFGNKLGRQTSPLTRQSEGGIGFIGLALVGERCSSALRDFVGVLGAFVRVDIFFSASAWFECPALDWRKCKLIFVSLTIV